MNNLWLKVFSLIFAAMLAYFVNYYFVPNESRMSVLQLIVPVEVQNVPPQKMILRPETRQAEITIQGPSLWVSRIASTPLLFRVSFPADVGNQFRAQLRKEDLNLPPYVDLLNVKPSEIEFILDSRIRKSVSINVPKLGTPPEFFKLEAIRVQPDKVELIGPETEVKSISSVQTEAIDLRDLRSSITREMGFKSVGNLTTIEPAFTSVEVAISSVIMERDFTSLPVEVRAHQTVGLVSNPATVNVRISGSRELVTPLSAHEIIPYVRLTETPALGERAKVGVDLPKGVSVVKIEPADVEFMVPATPLKAKAAERSKAGIKEKK